MPLSVFTSSSPSRLVPYAPPINSTGAELVTSDGRSLPLTGAKLRAEAKGGIARLVLEQTFENRYAETLQVTYRMPLPADGAVSAYAFDIADRTIAGRVNKKREAREKFERAVAEGKTAALLEQTRDDIFTQQIGNLPARETLVARITVDQKLAWLPEGEWELRFPTVIGPRYVSGTDATAKDAHDTVVAVDPKGVSARIQIAIGIGDTMTGRASSPSHRIKRDEGGMIELATDPTQLGAALDRDIVVRWPVATRSVGLSIDVARKGDDAYGLLTIVPPARDAAFTATPRDLIVLLDTSGSMGGNPLDKAKQVVAMMIDSLAEQDRLELIEFSMEARRWKREPVAATAQAKREAIAWVRELEANGGTEMARAVREALSALRPGAQRQVVLVTDGYVGGEQQIVQLLHDKLPKSCRMHFLGVGSSVNRSLGTAMARAGRGAEVLVDLDEDLERGIKRLVDRTKAPVLTNLEISGDPLVACAPEHVPDVFAGAPVVAAVKLSPLGGELVVRGEIAGAHAASGGNAGDPYRVAAEQWIQKIKIPPKLDGEGNQAIVALYAREHVADLEMRWTIGDQDEIDRQIETTGVRYQISTRMTSWVAIDEARRVDPLIPSRHEVVPQNVPYGTSAKAFGLRAAAVSQSFGRTTGFMASADFDAEEITGSLGAAPMEEKTVRGDLPVMARKLGAGAPRPRAAMPAAPMPMQQAQPPSGAPMFRASMQELDVLSSERATDGRAKHGPRWWIFFLLLALIAGFLVWWLVL